MSVIPRKFYMENHHPIMPVSCRETFLWFRSALPMVFLVCVALASDVLAESEQKAERAEEHRIQFSIDIIPILTKLGCNSGGCHGKSTGQNGFKLSLLGFEPEQDFAALVNEARGRRIFPGDSTNSLLIQKAIGRIPHGGGARLAVDSAEYEILCRWIEQGAFGPHVDDAQLQSLSVEPRRLVFEPASAEQLTVTAHFSDGSTRNVTRRAVYESNAPEIASSNQEGVVTSRRESGGLFAITIRFGDQIAVFQGEVPFNSNSPDYAVDMPSFDTASVVDQHLFNQWKRLNVLPSKVVDDYTFIRRATLDICGTLPTAKEAAEYGADQRAEKRVLLINRLLERPEYADYFALKWADILQNRGRGYSTRQQREGTTLFAAWIRDSLAANMPYDRFAAEIITATGSQESNPPTIWYRSVRTTQDYVESISQAFLGVRIQCAQCHHHPAERWTQADYYRLAAVFSRVGRKGGFADAEVPTNEIIYLKNEGAVYHPRSGELMNPRPLGGPDFELTAFDDPRHSFAEWMTADDNVYFARTMVNRLWGHFFGRGIIHPIDDARSSNPPSNPELLEALAQDFVSSGYDIKHLIREITSSYAYRLSSLPNQSNGDDIQSFARFYPQRLEAEVLLDGISQVLDVPTEFPGGPGVFPPGTRAVELPDENVPVNFLDVFGRPDRTSACECERTDSPALSQALELVNSSEIQRKLTHKEGLAQRLGTNDQSASENVRTMFLTVFARPPQQKEEEAAVTFLTAEPDRVEAYQSLLWSLLATNEFLFNH